MKIKINPHGNPMPEKFKCGDWIDLRATETVNMNKGEYRVISLGISAELPEGYEAHILPRSSTFRRWGVLMVNGMAVIDNSYNGDNDVWGFPALAMRDTTIYKGDRICQFRIVQQQPALEFEEVARLGNEDRGGFGSTGARDFVKTRTHGDNEKPVITVMTEDSQIRTHGDDDKRREVISQLISLQAHCSSMEHDDGSDTELWRKDVAALEYALEVLRKC